MRVERVTDEARFAELAEPWSRLAGDGVTTCAKASPSMPALPPMPSDRTSAKLAPPWSTTLQLTETRVVSP